MIQIFGDSHSFYTFIDFDDNIIRKNHLGAITMHRVGRDKLIILDENYIINNSLCIFCFGEIDVRTHFYKQIEEKKRKEEEVINSLVYNYIETIKLNIINKKIVTGIMSIIPPSYKENKDESARIKWYKFCFNGSDKQRAHWTFLVNKELKKYCINNNWEYIDIYSLYVDENGMLKDQYCNDGCHITDRIFIKQYMQKYITTFLLHDYIYYFNCNNIEKINLLLENGIDVNYKDLNNDTPMHYIIFFKKSIDWFNIFMQFKPNLHIKNKNNISVYDLLQKPENKIYLEEYKKFYINNLY